MKTKSILLFTLVILTITATIKAQNIPNYIPTNGLVGWWPFNGNANDESGNGNDGTVNGPILTNDRFGNGNNAYYFDQIGDFIMISNNAVFDFTEGTINLWFNTSQSNFMNVIERNIFANATNENWGIALNQNQWGDLSFYTKHNSNCSAGNGWQSNVTNQNIQNNYWHMITCVVLSQSSALYLDGTLVNILNTSSGLDICGGDIQIGRHWQNDPRFFLGNLDDIAIWNRALTPQEISNLYTASSTNNNVTSNTTANVPGAISYQAVARDAQGMPLADANLQVQFTLIADSLSGTAEYVETHTLTTNSLGLFTTAFGAGTPVSNTFGNINWTTGNKFLNVQIDTGNGWMDMGTQQLLSTPYSMHSATSGAIKNPGLPVFADNAAALAGGLVAGDMYRTASGDLKIVY